jgi:hypothetical protein
VNGVFYPPGLSPGASAVGAMRHEKTLSAITLHFRHERQAVQFALGVEAGENFLRPANFNQLAGPQIKDSGRD